MQQGRRTASLKASYEAVSKSVELTKELSVGREYGTASSRSAQASASDGVSTTKTSSGRSKKCVSAFTAYVIIVIIISLFIKKGGDV